MIKECVNAWNETWDIEALEEDITKASCKVIVKPHHEEDIFVITRGRGVNNKDILRVQVGFNWLLSQHGFYTTCLQ